MMKRILGIIVAASVLLVFVAPAAQAKWGKFYPFSATDTSAPYLQTIEGRTGLTFSDLEGDSFYDSAKVNGKSIYLEDWGAQSGESVLVGKLRIGAYDIRFRDNTPSQWRCSIYSEDVCHWSKGWDDWTSYTFYWDGSTMQNVRVRYNWAT